MRARAWKCIRSGHFLVYSKSLYFEEHLVTKKLLIVIFDGFPRPYRIQKEVFKPFLSLKKLKSFILLNYVSLKDVKTNILSRDLIRSGPE